MSATDAVSSEITRFTSRTIWKTQAIFFESAVVPTDRLAVITT